MSTRQRGVKHSITKRRTPGLDWEVRLRRVAGPRRVRTPRTVLSSQVVPGVTGVHPPWCNGSSTWLKTYGRVRANRSALRCTKSAPPDRPPCAPLAPTWERLPRRSGSPSRRPAPPGATTAGRSRSPRPVPVPPTSRRPPTPRRPPGPPGRGRSRRRPSGRRCSPGPVRHPVPPWRPRARRPRGVRCGPRGGRVGPWRPRRRFPVPARRVPAPVRARRRGGGRRGPGRRRGGRARGAPRVGGYAGSTRRPRPGHCGAARAGPTRGPRVPRAAGAVRPLRSGRRSGMLRPARRPAVASGGASPGRFGSLRELSPGGARRSVRAAHGRALFWVRAGQGPNAGEVAPYPWGEWLGRCFPDTAGRSLGPVVAPPGAVGTAARPPDPGFPPEPCSLRQPSPSHESPKDLSRRDTDGRSRIL